MASEYGSMTRDELRAFTPEAQAILLSLFARGWRGRLSDGAHVKLLAPDGVTQLSCSTNKDAARYLGERVARYYRDHPEEQAPKPKGPTTQKWNCPRPGCNRTYASDAQLSVHINADHEGLLPCPDCERWFANNQKLALHRSQKHGYVSPKKAQRLDAVARRKAKAQPAKTVEKQVIEILETAAEQIEAIEPVDVSSEPAPDEVPAPEPVPVVGDTVPDERLVIDHTALWDMDIRSIATVLHAAGLQLELSARRV